ncbi:DHA2 family efflux MFS transporter permease subunit [Acrocarpospora catenulata]|uniref:DHA2 family efflux MFS transporter permease subunit n=1 Tax=Acrocarpospora catenulata TaxID=2836182 RepID=UPI001BDA4A32|nr:DHA2 family efflux MFS transporter permease subunit [Acrocarpospora catenulata]
MNRWLALTAVALSTFMTYLDNNVVNVALPTIQRDLGLSISGLEWIVSAYILVFAGLLLVGGRLADVIGLRTVFFAGLGIFTAASVAAGLAGSQEVLIAARAVQGVGAALLAPSSLALLPRLFPDPKERATAVGIWSAVGALALAVGPLTGGLISDNVDWGWIFLINVPIALVTAVLAGVAMRVPTLRATGTRLDLPGLAASSVALLALTFALIEGESEGWSSGLILGAFGVAAAAFAAFLTIESRTRQPMIDLSLFRDRIFSGGLLAMGLMAFGVFGIYFFTAIYLQNALGFTPTEAGAGFVPMALLMAAIATVSSRIAERVGTARTVALSLALMAAAIGGLSGAGAGSGYLDLLPWFLLYGVGAGLLVPLTNVILGAMPAGRAGVASGVMNVSREVFGLLGITILGAILNARQTAPTMPAFLDAYQFTLLIAAAIVAIGVPVSLYALRRTSAPTPPAPVLEPVG